MYIKGRNVQAVHFCRYVPKLSTFTAWIYLASGGAVEPWSHPLLLLILCGHNENLSIFHIKRNWFNTKFAKFCVLTTILFNFFVIIQPKVTCFALNAIFITIRDNSLLQG